MRDPYGYVKPADDDREGWLDQLAWALPQWPWYACVFVGFIGWWVCSWYADIPMPGAVGNRPYGGLLVPKLLHALADLGVFAFPVIYGSAAVLSWRRGQRAP